MAIMNSYLEKPWDTPIAIDRVHKIGPIRPGPKDYPKDVVRCLHYYRVKEEVEHSVWLKGSLDFDGTDVSILPDLSRRTLMMRGILCPLLKVITSQNNSYRCGFPFHL